MPRLSIIIPVRNAADELACCLTAIRASSFADYEIIVLTAVLPDSAFSEIEELDGLREQLPGVLEILRIWFSHYKRDARLESRGFGGRREARRLLESAVVGSPKR